MATKKKKRLSKKQRMRRRRRRLLAVEIVILLAILGTVFVWFKLGQINWDTDLGDISTNQLDEETKQLLEGYTTVAIFGVDNRTQGNYKSGNSDSLMVASINNDTKEVKIMSVYRDSYLNIGEGQYQKCNAAYAYGGPQRSMEMINRNFDLDVQEYIAIDFTAMIDAVDAVGGVEIEVAPEEVEWLNAYLDDNARITKKSGNHITSSGFQKLDGIQALAFCRIRYTAGDDFRRASRQRIVLKALVEKAKTANVIQLNDMINALFPSISTSLSVTQCLDLAKSMQEYEIVDQTGWPFDLRTGTFGAKGSLVVPCTLQSNVIKAHQFLYGNVDYQVSETVKELSNHIMSDTGFNESSALDYMTWEGAGEQ